MEDILVRTFGAASPDTFLTSARQISSFYRETRTRPPESLNLFLRRLNSRVWRFQDHIRPFLLRLLYQKATRRSSRTLHWGDLQCSCHLHQELSCARRSFMSPPPTLHRLLTWSKSAWSFPPHPLQPLAACFAPPDEFSGVPVDGVSSIILMPGV